MNVLELHATVSLINCEVVWYVRAVFHHKRHRVCALWVKISDVASLSRHQYFSNTSSLRNIKGSVCYGNDLSSGTDGIDGHCASIGTSSSTDCSCADLILVRIDLSIEGCLKANVEAFIITLSQAEL